VLQAVLQALLLLVGTSHSSSKTPALSSYSQNTVTPGMPQGTTRRNWGRGVGADRFCLIHRRKRLGKLQPAAWLPWFCVASLRLHSLGKGTPPCRREHGVYHVRYARLLYCCGNVTWPFHCASPRPSPPPPGLRALHAVHTANQRAPEPTCCVCALPRRPCSDSGSVMSYLL
jgi:hypothetical protein